MGTALGYRASSGMTQRKGSSFRARMAGPRFVLHHFLFA